MRYDGAVARAIAEAAQWRLLGLLFERPREGWREEVAALAGETGDPSLAAAARAVATTATEGGYQHLFGPGGLVSPRGVSYRPLADPGAILAEISAHYDAFAFQPRVEDSIDHVAVEAGFVGYLFLKEAYARSGGDDEAAERTATARVCFVESHFSAFAGLIPRLEAAGPSYLVECGRLLGLRLPEPTAPRQDATDVDPFSSCAGCRSSG